MFKVGDKVKCINNKNTTNYNIFGNEVDLTVGKIYDIQQANDLIVRLVDDNGTIQFFYPERFELVGAAQNIVSITKFNIGDEIKIVNTTSSYAKVHNGKTGKIKFLGNNFHEVEIDGVTRHFSSDEMELVSFNKASQFKVGDSVKVKTNGSCYAAIKYAGETGTIQTVYNDYCTVQFGEDRNNVLYYEDLELLSSPNIIANQPCSHKPKLYQGLMESFNYCETCGVKL